MASVAAIARRRITRSLSGTKSIRSPASGTKPPSPSRRSTTISHGRSIVAATMRPKMWAVASSAHCASSKPMINGPRWIRPSRSMTRSAVRFGRCSVTIASTSGVGGSSTWLTSPNSGANGRRSGAERSMPASRASAIAEALPLDAEQAAQRVAERSVRRRRAVRLGADDDPRQVGRVHHLACASLVLPSPAAPRIVSTPPVPERTRPIASRTACTSSSWPSIGSW